MSKALLVLVVLGLFYGCQKDSPPPPSTAPGKATLVFPLQNSICTEGQVISPTETAIDFKWNEASNTDSYEVTIKNLISGEVINRSTAEVHEVVNLKRGTPYSWFITSKSRQTGVTAQSDVFKFYNAGPGILSYAPFPAEIIAPVMGQQVNAASGTVSLDWNGNDPDGDLVNYDLYFGASASPPLLRANLVESKMDGVTVSSKTVYFWRVISRDARGNTSDSGVFQFRVN